MGVVASPGVARAIGNKAASTSAAHRALEHAVRAGFAPGAVGLVAHDAEVDLAVVGRMATGGPAMRRDTIFRIASMTKPITAAAVMMLVEEGRLRLDEPIERLLPELADRRVLSRPDGPLDDTVPARRSITLEDLLTFRLGWGLALGPPGPFQQAVAGSGLVGFGPPDPATPLDGDEWLKQLARLPLLAQPGDRWLYDTGSVLQGVLIARASGRSFSTFLAERLFGPLSMVDTGFHVPPAKIDRLATAYQPAKGKLVVSDDPRTGRWSRPPRFEQGDAGLVSTADDYLAFVRMLLAGGEYRGRRLLSNASVTAMTTNHLTPWQRQDGSPILGKSTGWGYGLSVVTGTVAGGPPAGSIGWFGGFGTSWRSDPKRDVTSILLTQRGLDGPELPPLYRAFDKAAGIGRGG